MTPARVIQSAIVIRCSSRRPAYDVFWLHEQRVFYLDEFGLQIVLLFQLLLRYARSFKVVLRRLLNVRDPIERIVRSHHVSAILSDYGFWQCSIVRKRCGDAEVLLATLAYCVVLNLDVVAVARNLPLSRSEFDLTGFFTVDPKFSQFGHV